MEITFVDRKGTVSITKVLNGLSSCVDNWKIASKNMNGVSVFAGHVSDVKRTSSEYRIHYMLLESDHLPNTWKNLLNANSDEIWVSQEWQKQVFTNDGVVVPIEVVPLGTDPPILNLQKLKSDFFQFTIIAAFTNRKHIIETCEIFNRVFSGRKNVILRIHCSYGNDQYAQKVRAFSSPQIHITSGVLSFEEYQLLWQNTDCILSPSKGEGWGYPPREALFYDIPSIVSDIPAYADLNDCRVVKVKISHMERAIYHSLHENAGNNWIVDTSDFARKMEIMVMHPIEFATPVFHNKTWQDMREFINEKFIESKKKAANKFRRYFL